MIQPTLSFKENLQLLPSIETLARIELIGATGDVIASIENQPGKQGSLVVYQYLSQEFGKINTEAAQHGLEVLRNTRQMPKHVPVRIQISINCWAFSMG